MSDGGIGLQPNIQVSGLIENLLESAVELPIQPTEFALPFGGSENGGVYFNRGWQNSRAEHLRQKLDLGLPFVTLPEPFPESNLPENVFDLNDAWNSIINSATEHEDFEGLYNESENFWQQVRNLSEPKSLIAEDNQSAKISRYDELLTEMRERELPPDEFAETLPPEERKVFKARHQIDETFGRDFLRNGDASAEPDKIIFPEKISANSPSFGDAEIVQPGFTAAENGSTNQPIITSDDAPPNHFNSAAHKPAESFAPPVAEYSFGRIDAEIATEFSGIGSDREALIENKLEKNAVVLPGNPNVLTAENGNSRSVNNPSNDVSANNINAARRIDGGAATGGTLISNALATFENYENLKNREIGGSGFVAQNGAVRRNDSAAGATGILMSAAIGSVIPNGESAVGGVLGFLSGVVVGVETEQGLRWLSGERPKTFAPPENINLLEENSFGLNLQTLLA